MMEFKLNLRKDPDDKRDFPFMSSFNIEELKSGLLATAPDVIDHSDLMSPVKNQGALGSCVGFAMAAMKEWQEQKEHKEEVEEGKFDHRDDKYYDLSESWIYWMSKKIDPWPDMEGTSIRYAMKVINKIGVPCEKAWPYSDEVQGEPSSWASLVAKWSLVGSYYRVKGIDDLINALVKGPVVIGVACFEEIFFTGKDGIVAMPRNPRYCYGGHAVCAVGYDKSKQLVKFKNSWGTGWGKEGYGYLPYKYIVNYMWDGWYCQDLNVTKDMLKGARELI